MFRRGFKMYFFARISVSVNTVKSRFEKIVACALYSS